MAGVVHPAQWWCGRMPERREERPEGPAPLAGAGPSGDVSVTYWSGLTSGVKPSPERSLNSQSSKYAPLRP
jgi:hypothetical protein